MRSYLNAQFEKCRLKDPSLFGDCEIIGKGHWGCVARKEDGTLRKFGFRRDDPASQQAAEFEMQKEYSNLLLLNAGAQTSFAIPEVLGELTEIESEGYFACYDMTELKGAPANWGNAHDVKDIFYQSGRMVGEFQSVASELADNFIFRHPENNIEPVPQIPGLGDEINHALSLAHDFLVANNISKVIHGDFHSGNVIADDSGNLTGLIDFAQTGRSHNFITDFQNIPLNFMRPFVQGFVETSGMEIAEEMMDITDLTRWAGMASRYSPDTDHSESYAAEIRKSLSRISHITGFQPE